MTYKLTVTTAARVLTSRHASLAAALRTGRQVRSKLQITVSCDGVLEYVWQAPLRNWQRAGMERPDFN